MIPNGTIFAFYSLKPLLSESLEKHSILFKAEEGDPAKSRINYLKPLMFLGL